MRWSAIPQEQPGLCFAWRLHRRQVITKHLECSTLHQSLETATMQILCMRTLPHEDKYSLALQSARPAAPQRLWRNLCSMSAPMPSKERQLESSPVLLKYCKCAPLTGSNARAGVGASLCCSMLVRVP